MKEIPTSQRTCQGGGGGGHDSSSFEITGLSHGRSHYR